MAGVLAALVLAVAGGSTVEAAAVRACGPVRSGASHKVSVIALPCTRGRYLARTVLRRRRAPAGWTCSLGQLGKGFAACKREDSRFYIVPA